MQSTIRRRATIRLLLGAAAVVGGLAFRGTAAPADPAKPRAATGRKGRSPFWAKNNKKFTAIFEHDTDFPEKVKLKSEGVTFHKADGACYRFDVNGQPKRNKVNPKLLEVKVKVRKQPVICIHDEGKAPAVPNEPAQDQAQPRSGQQKESDQLPTFDEDLMGEGELTITVEDDMGMMMEIEEAIDVIGLAEDPCG